VVCLCNRLGTSKSHTYVLHPTGTVVLPEYHCDAAPVVVATTSQPTFVTGLRTVALH